MVKENYSDGCIHWMIRELNALQQENSELKQQIKTLKKAVALFAK